MKEVPIYMQNRTYYLCMEQRYLSVVLSLWIDNYKPCPIGLRNARKGVEESVVVIIKDENGNRLDFIAKIVSQTHAKVEAR